MRNLGRLIGCGLLCLVAGCGAKSEKPFTKATIKVSGIITVDGSPPETPIQLECRSELVSDAEHPSVSSATTSEDGSFEISTYAPGDGVPEGSYSLVATCLKFDALSNQFKEPDLLRGKYDAIEESPKTFEVAAGDEPLDLGTIDLKGSGKKK